MANININMTVNTSVLSLDVSQSVIDGACVLTDDNGDPSGHQDFIINAEQGDTVTFTICSQDGSAPVAFSSFYYHSGTNGVFSELPSLGNNWVGTVETGQSDVSETFYIDFTADGNSYTLDPRISVGH